MSLRYDAAACAETERTEKTACSVPCRWISHAKLGVTGFPGRDHDALLVEGALIAPAMLTRVVEQKAGGQAESDSYVQKALTLRDEIARYFRIGQALFTNLRANTTPTAAASRLFEALLRHLFGCGETSLLDEPLVNCRHSSGYRYPIRRQTVSRETRPAQQRDDEWVRC
jgi:hypothetical protein